MTSMQRGGGIRIIGFVLMQGGMCGITWNSSLPLKLGSNALILGLYWMVLGVLEFFGKEER